MANKRTGYQSSGNVQMFDRAGVEIALALWQQSRDLPAVNSKEQYSDETLQKHNNHVDHIRSHRRRANGVKVFSRKRGRLLLERSLMDLPILAEHEYVWCSSMKSVRVDDPSKDREWNDTDFRAE
jgi:hypothetical protein